MGRMKKSLLQWGFLLLLGGTASAQWECKQAKFNFGKRSEGDVFYHTFSIKNTGSTTLVVKQVESDCSCMSAWIIDRVIDPGEEGTVKVQVNLSYREGEQSRSVYVHAVDPKIKPITLQICGMSIVRTHVTPRMLTFRNSTQGVVSKKEVVLLGVEEDLDPGTPRSNSHYLKSSFRAGTKKGEYILTVELSESAPVGKTTAVITFPVYKTREKIRVPVFKDIKAPSEK